MTNFKELFDKLPMPKCGTKSTLGCYNCTDENNCIYIKEHNNLLASFNMDKLTIDEKAELVKYF